MGRQTAIDTNGRSIGYGFAGSSASNNRTIQEYTLGFTQNFSKSRDYGTLSLINQYSYMTRNPWAVAVGAPKGTHASIYYINRRYRLS